MKTKNKPKESYHILYAVITTMIVIITVWAIWFFPKTDSSASNRDTNYGNFKKDILNSFSVFNNSKDKEDIKVNVNDLRARVFGDTIER